MRRPAIAPASHHIVRNIADENIADENIAPLNHRAFVLPARRRCATMADGAATMSLSSVR
jgi:hypothetical protein